MYGITWLHFIVLILASFRLTHLIVYDEITSFIRQPFLNITYEADENGQIMRRTEIKGSGFRRLVGFWLNCHWCVGVWSSVAIVFLYGVFPITFPLLLVLAIAGAAAIIESRMFVD